MVQNQPLQPGDRVRLAEHLVPHFDGQTHGIVDQHAVGKRYQDVQVNVGGTVYWFAETDLTLDPLPELPQRIRGATLTASYVDAGVQPATSNLDSWTCSQCGWETHAAGPVDVDEPDPFQESIDEHRRGHAPEEPVYQPGREPRDVHPGWYEVPTIPLWMALRTVPSVLNALTAVMATPPADVAQALRAVADVLAGDEK